MTKAERLAKAKAAQAAKRRREEEANAAGEDAIRRILDGTSWDAVPGGLRPLSSTERSHNFRALGRELGEIPNVVDPLRRLEAQWSLLAFGLKYCMGPDKMIKRHPSPRMVKFVDALQATIEHGGNRHVRWPRGKGKSTWLKVAAIWALVYGYRKFVVIIAATRPMAEEMVTEIWRFCSEDPLFAEDFPMFAKPLHDVSLTPQRCRVQTYKGVKTHICENARYSYKRFAILQGYPQTGGIIAARGADQAIRGLNIDSNRPDFIFLDDPQTDEDAKSTGRDGRVDKIEARIQGALQGLGETNKTIASVMASTPIEPNDISERYADPERHGEWLTTTEKLVVKFGPKEWITRYLKELQRDNAVHDVLLTRSRAFYEAHRAEIEQGVEMMDDQDFDPQLEVSAYQHALNRLHMAHEVNQTIIEFINRIVAEVGRPKHEYVSCAVPAEMFEEIKKIVPPEQMEVAVFTDDKMTREGNIAEITKKLEEAFADNEEWLAILGEAVYQYEKKTVRKMILKDHKRPDGREITQIRPLSAEVDIIPRVHGSSMFTRGQTQICDICTLAPLSEMQRVDGLDSNEVSKRYMHHYNFPSYSVGETKPSRGPGRREIGHGALAERALIPVLPSEEEFPYAIRCVSETFESNGSTSMASTCASCMSLMAAGVPIKKMVAGISCGLVTGDTDDDFVLLTDIQGLEDFFGDMDFKVTGTTEGITAIQMDIKIHGLTRPIVEGAIARCREARLFIMDTCMKPAISEPRPAVNEYAPKIVQIKIDPEKIGDVVGQRGKTINAIIDQTGVKIDITDDGSVSVCGTDQEMMDKAIELIKIITTDFVEGQMYKGKVVSIKEFGAFIEFAPGKEGMVHISKIARERINHVEDVLTLGDEVKVKCLGKDKLGRVSFSIKDAK